MREIKLRGKGVFDNEFHYGFYAYFYEEDGTPLHYICDVADKSQIVYPDTVGQYTGLKDKNSIEIYEGDILAPDKTCRGSSRYIVEWNDKHCCFTSIEGGIDNFIGDIDEEIQYSLLSNMKLNVCEIIGNIYENPELLKGEQ